MFKLRFIIRVGIALVVTLGVAYGLAALRPDPLGQTAAGWAQALGAIGAIGVAIWIARRQYIETEQRERIERMRTTENLYESVIAMGQAACDALDAVDEARLISPHDFGGYAARVSHDHVAWLTSRVEALPLQDFGDTRAVVHIIGLRHALAEYSGRIPVRGMPPTVDANIPGTKTKLINEIGPLKLILAELRATHDRSTV